MSALRLAYKACAAAQWALLLALPHLLRPYWPAYLAFIGGEQNANVLGNALVSSLVLLANNLFFLALYRAEAPFFEAFRVSRAPWPWRAAPAKAAAFAATVRQGALLTLLNVALTLPLGYASYGGAKRLGYSAALDTYPSALTVAWQLAVFMAVEDALFYWGHRALHHPSVYARVHKLHHAFHHSVSIAATATHPLEYAVSNVVPFVAGPTILGAHAATMYIWIVFRVTETVVNHSGYALPWSMFELLPFQGSARAHDLHHSKNTGNFGSLFEVWDRAMGTCIDEGEEGTAKAE
jgi:sterol desaturase/sphingolipid hydroxylase (fatty acid hydroxylase superfamily)